jgi:hypothetical protein
MRNIARVIFTMAVVSVAGCGGMPPPPFKLVSDTKTLMDSVIEKQANVVWESVGEIATLEGVEERRPKTEEDWKNIKDAAVTITESANLLMMSPHAKDNEEWMAASAGLIEQGQRMISAIERKNPQGVFDIGADMYEACVRCHRQYMPGVAIMYRR